MKARGETPSDIDGYIAACPPQVRASLQELRGVIAAAAPDAVERISYRIPTFALHGNLVHFAAFGQHIGFYPGASGVRAFIDELAGYEISKGTVRFPHDRPIPAALVRRIVKFRVRENRSRAAGSKRK